jgi:hypothetical protein
MALVALTACGTTMWRQVDAHRIKPREQAFVVTVGHAYLVDVSVTTTDALHGVPIRAWSFAEKRLKLRESDSPDENASRLGWVRRPSTGAPREIAMSDVVYVSQQAPDGRETNAATFAGAVVGVVVVLVVSGFFAFQLVK